MTYRKAVLVLAAVAVPVAVARYFMRGWVEPFGVPAEVGSFFASLTLVLLAGLVILFRREARTEDGRYHRAAAAYALLAIWCELLAIGGILLTARSGAETYYAGPWETVHRAFPDPTQHAIAHAQGFVPRLAVALALGALVYALSRRGRRLAA